jgi:hypothetical protein
MIKLDNVTLICVDGVGKFNPSIDAIKKSTTQIKFANLILLTSETFEKSDYCKIIKIPKMNWNEYNRFIITKLSDYFNTDFVLLCQDDGYVSNAQMWSNDFLKYDYNGAPWPLDLMNQLMFNLEKGLDLNKSDFEEELKLNNYNGHNYRVGNGGFSLRSKRLCEFTKQFDNKYLNKPEDNIISIYEKESIERNGMKIAPLEIAAKFSVESATELNPFRDKNITFGFHRF